MRSVERVSARRRRVGWVVAVLLGLTASAPAASAASAAAVAPRRSAAARAPNPARATDNEIVSPIDVERGAPVRIEVVRFTRAVAGDGMFCATLRIDNRGPEPLTWNVTLRGGATERWMRRDRSRLTSAAFTLGPVAYTVPAGSAREFPLRLPAPDTAGSLFVHGPYVANPLVHVAHWEHVGPLFTPTVWSAVRDSLDGNTLHSVRLPGEFPEDPTELDAFPMVVVPEHQWGELTEKQQEAIRRYVALGGRLNIASGVDGPPPLPPATFGLAPLNAARNFRPYGLGQVGVFPFDAEPLPRFARERQPADLGWLLSTALPDWMRDRLPRLPIHLVLGATAILAGPVTFFWFARRRGRQWIFVALPAIALGATLALVAVILLQDGTGGRGRRYVTAVLIDGRPEMVVRQIQGARAGWLGSREFEVPADVRMSFAARPATPGELVIERNGSRCSGDWFRNRTVTAHVLRREVPTRANVAWRGDARHPAVVSTFAAPLEDFIAWRDGDVWYAERVEPGRETALRLMSPELWAKLEKTFDEPLSPPDETVLRPSAEPGAFIARTAKLDGAPIETLGAIRWEDHIVVQGHCLAP